MHILFTRPLEDSEELILKFRDLGHKVSHMPVIQIEKVEYEKINFLDYKAIIFTSANALKFLDTKLIDKIFKVFGEIISLISSTDLLAARSSFFVGISTP